MIPVHYSSRSDFTFHPFFTRLHRYNPAFFLNLVCFHEKVHHTFHTFCWNENFTPFIHSFIGFNIKGIELTILKQGSQCQDQTRKRVFSLVLCKVVKGHLGGNGRSQLKGSHPIVCFHFSHFSYNKQCPHVVPQYSHVVVLRIALLLLTRLISKQ